MSMQFLKISPNTKLQDLASRVGSKSLANVLRVNNLERTPNIGKALTSMCSEIVKSSKDVSWQRKQSLLVTAMSDSDIFEDMALSDNQTWKVISGIGTFPGMIRMPEGFRIPDAVDTIGNGVTVDKLVYHRAINSVINAPHIVDSEIFNSFSNSRPVKISQGTSATEQNLYQYFHLPWGKISLYSSLAGTSLDFPVYPEDLSDRHSATYGTMPDQLYQYEPWYVYQSSGPRSNTYTFYFHRDMWTGDHRDGKANELIRFCQANCYPDFNGSMVNTSTVRLYIAGKPIINGVLTEVSTNWSGPIGLDGFYLVCKLSLTISEVSEEPLNFHSVRSKSLIG